jgi:hypothetical protein
MPTMNLPANMRALCGFYALGKRITEIAAPPDMGYVLAPGPTSMVGYWSHSESTIIGDDKVHVFEFYVSEITKVESVHAFGFCMLDRVLIGNQSFPNENKVVSKLTNPALWLLTPSRSLIPNGRVVVVARGTIKHFGIQDDNKPIEPALCATCGHEQKLHGPAVGCMSLDCDCMQYCDHVSPPVEAP